MKQIQVKFLSHMILNQFFSLSTNPDSTSKKDKLSRMKRMKKVLHNAYNYAKAKAKRDLILEMILVKKSFS
jgi:hypothetical protein